MYTYYFFLFFAWDTYSIVVKQTMEQKKKKETLPVIGKPIKTDLFAIFSTFDSIKSLFTGVKMGKNTEDNV